MTPLATAQLKQSQITGIASVTMQALIKDGTDVSVKSIEKPKLEDAQSVIVRVTVAGLCRTDLYAAQGKIKVCNPLVLGHEFAGIIDTVGSEVEQLRPGQRVTVNPVLPCGKCNYCSTGRRNVCQHYDFLGVDRCGCFAEYVCVPASSIHVLPDTVSDLAAAYAEPVAASLAVVKTGIEPHERGLIYGKNRFSQLLQKILAVRGIQNITIYDPIKDAGQIGEGEFDYVVETMISTDILQSMVHMVRPKGKIILKSRQHDPVSFVMTQLLKKEPVMHVANYGPFEEALELLSTGDIDVTDLVDGVYKLEDFEKIIAAAERQEALKPFFAPGER